jgi:DNA-binding response OmpR family regulator
MGIIVVIEDDTRIQKTLRRLFEGENYEVQVLHDGVNAKEETSAPGVEAVEPRYLRTIHGAGYKFVPEG